MHAGVTLVKPHNLTVLECDGNYIMHVPDGDSFRVVNAPAVSLLSAIDGNRTVEDLCVNTEDPTACHRFLSQLVELGLLHIQTPRMTD